MAVVAQTNQDEEQNGQQPNSGGGGQVLNSSGSSGPTTGSSASPGTSNTAAQPAQQATPSGRPNIQQYVNANQGAGQQLAGGIQRNVQTQYNQFNQNYGQAQDTLNQQYNPISQGLGSGQQAAQSAFQDPQALLDAYTQAQNAPVGSTSSNTSQQPQSGTPTATTMPITGDQFGINRNASNQTPQVQQPGANLDAYNQFQKLQNGGYSTDINNYQTAAQTALSGLQPQQQNLQQEANASQNEMGRFQLLRQAIGQPNYSQGQQTLDAAFLQGQPGVANQLQQNVGNIANQANQQVTGATNNVTNQIANLNQQSGDTQSYIKNLFQNGLAQPGQGVATNQLGLGGITTDSQNRLAQQQALANTLPDLQKQLASNTLTPQALQELNKASGSNLQGTDLYGVDASKFINQAVNQATIANTADPAEAARFRALNQLTGGGQADLYGGVDQSKIGGFNPFNFDTSGFNTAVAGAKQNYETDKVNQLISNFIAGGWTAGDRSGGTSQGHSRDDGAPLRAVFAQQLANLKQNPGTNEYQGLINAYNTAFGKNAWNDPTNNNAQLTSARQYANTLGQMRGDILGGAVAQPVTTPGNEQGEL